MARPSKPANVIQIEGRSHRTKRELAQRKQAEKSLLTGVTLRESPDVKASPIAHKEFRRVTKLLDAVEKNDDLYGAVINRYCLMHAECAALEKQIEEAIVDVRDLEDAKESFAEAHDLKTYFTTLLDLRKTITNLDKQLQAKRKMMFDIEKENIMTVAAALRSVPKKPETRKNALMEALSGEG